MGAGRLHAAKYVIEHGKPLPRSISGKILKRELRSGYPKAPVGATQLRA